MSMTPIARAVAFAALGSSITVPTLAHAEFIKDSKASIELRNFYFNRDFRQEGASQSKAEEWAQGFLLRYESGYTEGTIGFGVDAIGLLGVKLDSSPAPACSSATARPAAPRTTMARQGSPPSCGRRRAP